MAHPTLANEQIVAITDWLANIDVVTMFNALASCNLCMDQPHPQWAGQYNVVTIAHWLANMDVVAMFNGLASCNQTIDHLS